MIKLSDYVFDYLAERGVRDVFLVSGGGIMHLCDSVGRHPKIRYIANNHEQACAIAAEAYARVKNSIGVCLVTTGPGSANALSGIVSPWFDSIPVLVLSGQVRVPLLADYSQIRQLGPQEMNTIPMVRPVTKYASQVRDPSVIRAELDRAFREATSGRPGPAWLDIPLDVQATMIDENDLLTEPLDVAAGDRSPNLRENVARTLAMLEKARRPLLILGNGLWLSGGAPLVASLLDRLQIPVLLPIAAMDLVPEDHSCHLGAFGPFGRRAANFALQNSDFFLSIGAGLSLASVGFQTRGFASRATKVVVNIDAGELAKPVLAPDLPIRADARDFLEETLRQLGGRRVRPPQRWRDACSQWKAKYPPGPGPGECDPAFVNSYRLAEELSDLMEPGDVVATGNSLDACSVYQSFRVKRDQRVLINANCGPMGWDLPGAVGAAVAHAPGRVVLLAGDGSIQFNIQELQTIRQNNLNVKIFLLNNDGYESIRSTQLNYFEGRFVGSSRDSGIGNPDFAKLCEAYRIGYDRLAAPTDMRPACARVLAADGPILCEVMVSPTQARTPKASSFRRPDGTMESRPIEDMSPFLPPDEVWENMHLFDDETS